MNEQYLVNKVLKAHKKIIIDHCFSIQPDLTAVILYGSYGQNEGSWFQDISGDWKPYNDYDLCIVSHKRIPAEHLKSLKNTLAKEIGIKWIDLSQFHPDDMKRMQPSILNYDFKNAGKVIYGNSTVLDLIPVIDRADLSMRDAKILFFTRLYTLLGSLGEKGLDIELEGEASRFFRNQMAKAILAVVDVLLLAKGAYDTSYRKRVEQVAKLYTEKEELLELSRWALAEKLRPQAPMMEPKEVRVLYSLVHKHFFAEMYWGLRIYFGKAVNSPEDVEHCMKWHPILIMKRISWIVRFRNFREERRIDVMLAQSYIAAAWSPDGINKNKLSRGIAFLRRADGRVNQQMTWDEARLEAARLRMEV